MAIGCLLLPMMSRNFWPKDVAVILSLIAMMAVSNRWASAGVLARDWAREIENSLSPMTMTLGAKSFIPASIQPRRGAPCEL
jgi:hypothetical protein